MGAVSRRLAGVTVASIGRKADLALATLAEVAVGAARARAREELAGPDGAVVARRAVPILGAGVDLVEADVDRGRRTGRERYEREHEDAVHWIAPVGTKSRPGAGGKPPTDACGNVWQVLQDPVGGGSTMRIR